MDRRARRAAVTPAGRTPRPAPDDRCKGADNPFFSPDGQWVGFAADRKLQKVSLSGGAPVTLCDVDSLRGAVWGADNQIVFAAGIYTGLSRVPATGGKPQAITHIDRERGERSHRWPEILPDGAALLTIGTGGSFDRARIVAVRPGATERVSVIDGGTNPRYLPSGHIMYGRGGSLMAVPFDASRLEVTGPPVEVLQGVINDDSGAVQYSISATGTLAYLAGPPGGAERHLLWIRREGQVERINAPPAAYRIPRSRPMAAGLS